MIFSISSNYLNKHTHFEKLFNDTFFTSIELHEDHINKNIIDNKIEVSAIIPNTDFYNQLNIDNSSKLSDKINLYESINAKRILIDTEVLLEKNNLENFDNLIIRITTLIKKLKLVFLVPNILDENYEIILDKLLSNSNSNYFLALNSKNILLNGSQPSIVNRIPENLIDYIQLTDIPKFIDDHKMVNDIDELLPNEGVLDLKSFIKIFLKRNYNSVWSISNSKFSSQKKTNLFLDINKSMISIFDDVTSSDNTFINIDPNLPPKIGLSGIEFLEFTVFDKDYISLINTLKKLSFRLERIHKTKKVELWRQGSINILVNSQKNSFAEQVYKKNGPSICDIAIKVKDADQTILRAKKLGVSEHLLPVSVGELQIPAINGVDGSVLHFIDQKSNLFKLWNVDFNSLDVDPQQPAGLRCIDHISQSMKEDEMTSWLFFYLSNFIMNKSSKIDLVSTKGKIISQALSSPEGEVRLNLNGSNDNQTIAGSFLNNKSGSSIQHIAFQTDDIFETAEILLKNEFPFLKIHESYYDKLNTKYNLDLSFFNDLKSKNILYEKDEFGEYFQFYSQPMFSGFFFEIVQRKQNYKGYGESNATYRIKSLQNYYDERKSA